MPSDEPGPRLEKPPWTRTLVDRAITCMRNRQEVGGGVVSAFKQAIAPISLVTTGTVQTPFFLGAREKGYHGNLSNPKAWVLVITDILI